MNWFLNMKKWLLLLACASILFLFAGQTAGAQGAITVSSNSFKIDYPNQITFQAAASSSAPITTATLVARFPGGLTSRLPAQVTPAAQVNVSVVWNLRGVTGTDLGGYLPPGAKGEYSWHLEDQAGNKFDTPFQPFKVEDTRETWKTLTNDKVALYWYDGGQDFGQGIFDKANQTLAAIQNDIGATLDGQVQIYIWGNRDEFMSALSPGNHEWAGGTIDDTFGVVLINADSGSLGYALSTVPHELTHLVIAQDLKGPFKDIAMPLWMNEGLAVYHEYIPPKDEPRFDAAVRRGVQTDTLFRLKSISGNFPNDASVVDMAYGEGFSVVDFMIRTYGRDKLKQIMTLFKEGTTADDAFMQVLGVDQDGLENAWRKSIGAQVKDYPKAATPTPGGVPTLSFSSAATPSAATPTPAEVAQAQTPVLSPNPAPTTSSPGSAPAGGLCGLPIGAAALALFGFWRVKQARGQ